MTKCDFAALACKLLGVYFFIKLIGLVPMFIFTIVSSSIVSSFALASQEPISWIGFLSVVISFLNAIIVVGISLLLWFKARQFAERIFPEDSAPTTLAVDKNLMPIVLSVTGVIIIAIVLPRLFSQTITSLQSSDPLGGLSSDKMMQNRIDGWVAVFQTLIGIWLVFGAGRISRIIKTAIHATQNQEA